MVCPKCGTQNPNDAKFCENCGARLGADVSLKFCPACRAPLVPRAKFCGSCGAPVTAAPPSAPAMGPAPAPSPQPAPAPMPAPAPAPRPAAPYSPGPWPAAGPYPAPAIAPRRSACGIACAVLLLLFLGLGVAGFFFGKQFLLSRPEALAGKWKISDNKSPFVSAEFVLEPVQNGKVQLKRADGKPTPFDIVFEPKGNQEFVVRMPEPANPSAQAEVTLKLLSFTDLEMAYKASNGNTEVVKATRVTGP